MDLGLNHKVAIVTGASQGIGLRTARRLAAEGCHLGLCARGEAALAAAATELRAGGARVCAIPADVTDPAQAEHFVERCAAELGGVDILINSVGGGSIVNISSISGWQAQLAGTAQYGAAKAALIFMAERLALELVHDGIRVNTVSPGSIVWDGGSWDDWRKESPEAYAVYVRDGFPMGRLGSPEEVADAIAFVASPAANWINGRHIPVDGLEQPAPAERPW